jgi:hypothetical protein
MTRWNGRGLNGSTTKLYIPPARTTVPITAFFGNWPEYNPDGTPATDDINITYQWTGYSCDAAYTVPLSPAVADVVPVDPGGHVTSPVAPTLAVNVTVPLTLGCQRLGVRFFQPPRQSDFASSMSAWITRTPPADLPAFDPARDAAGNLILYTVSTTGEVQEVQTSGKLSAKPEGVLRYFFTNCEHARQFRGSMLEAGRDAAGITRIPTRDDIVPDLIGVIAKKSGKSNLQAWGLSEGAGVVWDQAQVEPSGGCSL